MYQIISAQNGLVVAGFDGSPILNLKTAIRHAKRLGLRRWNGRPTKNGGGPKNSYYIIVELQPARQYEGD